MKEDLTETFSLKKLRISTNWCLHRSKFYDLSPDLAFELEKKYSNEEYVLNYFDEELLHIEYGLDRRWTLVLLWKNVIKSGQYILSISDESWVHKSPVYDEMTTEEILKEMESNIKIRTRSLEEITNAVNDLMLKISLENGDYPNYPPDLQLQEFIPDYYIRYVKNEFFDIEPSQSLSDEQWKLFQEEMLIVERYKDSDWQVTAGWFPAFDPNGQYRIKVSLEKLDKEMFEIFETKDKKEAVDYINEVFSMHLKKLYARYEKKVKADKERARQLKLHMQRNQKI